MDLSSPSIDRSFSIDRTPSIERTASLDSRSILSVLENSNLPYTEKYNRITRALRSALLRYNPDIRNQKELIRSIFRRIDENDSGTLTSDEMLAFISSPELGLFEINDQNAAKFCDLIVEQIDVNRYSRKNQNILCLLICILQLLEMEQLVIKNYKISYFHLILHQMTLLNMK